MMLRPRRVLLLLDHEDLATNHLTFQNLLGLQTRPQIGATLILQQVNKTRQHLQLLFNHPTTTQPP